jgi:hypothetical protein
MPKENKLVILVTALALSVLSVPTGLAQANECTADRQRYHDLNEPLFYHGQKGDQRDRQRYDKIKKSGTAALSDFVQNIVLGKLDNGASAPEIASYLSCLQEGDSIDTAVETRNYFSLKTLNPDTTNTPSSFGEQVLGGPLNVTALVLNRGANVIPETKPIVQCFARRGNHWALVGQAGAEYEQHTFDVYHLQSPVPTETWLLLAGKLLGSSAADLKLELVTCAHTGVAVKWRRSHLYGGKVSVENDGRTVILSYDKPGLDGIVPPIHGEVEIATEVLSVTPEGLR